MPDIPEPTGQSAAAEPPDDAASPPVSAPDEAASLPVSAPDDAASAATAAPEDAASAAIVAPATDAPQADAASAPPSAPGMTVRACADQLRERFPALFDGPARPLKLRIQADIQQRAPGIFPRQVLSAFLRRHTGSTSYLNAMARGGARFDLDGQPAGDVAPDHQAAAATEVARRRSSQQARIEQEREALRQQREALRQEREALRREQDALHREQQQAMRQRATLLHDYENTRLSAANFCVLKGIDPARLEEILAQARLEARERREAGGRDERPRRAETGPDRQGRNDRGERPARRDRPDGAPRADRPPRGPGGPRR